MRETLMGWAASGYAALLPLAQVGLALFFVVLLPMAAIRRTRGLAGRMIYLLSWPIGICTWLLGAVTCLSSFGWIGLIVGLLLMGLGVVPVGIVGALFSLEQGGELAATLFVMSLITYALRLLGLYLEARPQGAAVGDAGDDRPA